MGLLGNEGSKRALLATAAGVLAVAGIEAQAVVDCNAYDTPYNPLQVFIDDPDYDSIEFTGTCVGGLFIGRSDVTLQGVGETLILGGVTVQGARRVSFRKVVINAPEGGVFFLDGAYVRVDDSTIENTRDGFGVIRNSATLVQNSFLGSTLGTDPAQSCGPVCALEDSSIRLVNTTVRGDVDEPGIGPALTAFRDSSIVLRGVNDIANDGEQAAVGIFGNSSLRQDNLSTEGPSPPPTTIYGGLDVMRGSYADVRDAVITDGIRIDLDSTVRLGASIFGNPVQFRVDGDVILSRRSTLAVEDARITIDGDVVCADKTTSRIDGDFQGVGKRHCLRFSSIPPGLKRHSEHFSHRLERLARRLQHAAGEHH